MWKNAFSLQLNAGNSDFSSHGACMCYGLKAAEFKLVLICDHCDVLT